MLLDKKLVILAGVALAILAVTTAAASTAVIFLWQTPKPPASVGQTVSIPKPEIPLPKVSKFASDADLLKLRDAAKALGTKIDTVDLFEPQISPPNLDLNLRIN